jgi:hypothetical protein
MMLSVLITVVVVLLIAGLLFGPSSWGYTNARSPIALFLVVLLVLFLLLYP